MKHIKFILVRDFILSLLLQSAAIGFLALPQLENIRISLASQAKLPEGLLWIPVLALLLVANILILRRFIHRIADPVKDLANQTTLTTQSFAFKKRSYSWEEDVLKHYIEGQSIRRSEMERQAEEMEAELEKLQTELDEASAEAGRCDTDLAELRATIAALQEENSQLKARIPDPASHDANRDARVEAEVERRANELCAKVEAALANATRRTASAGSMMFQELREPLARISNLARQMIDSWADTSLTRLKAAVAEILSHSEQQLEKIDALVEGAEPPPPAKPLLDLDKIPLRKNGSSSNESPRLTSSLRGSLAGLTRRYSAQSETVEVRVDIAESVEDGIQDRGFLDLLDKLLDLAVCQLQEGEVVVSVEPQGHELEVSVSPQGSPRLGNSLDLTRVNRLANSLEGKIEVDSDNPREMRLRFRANPYARATRPATRIFEL